MMTINEMKNDVCEKLGRLLYYSDGFSGINAWCWRNDCGLELPVNWDREGLQICHEAEKLLKHGIGNEVSKYIYNLNYIGDRDKINPVFFNAEQKLEALCRVWWPERFE